ncbi:hypothetical protein BDQ12DRAFT_674439 [Crucibulum laeve]|uniref:Uncharacterized protein n=1 Tax=Crucibulum laeve TaxID=68775 RepID=A0A5C3MPI4_9AGAR|nr:hypothetical protein BDQ12DRAFT_674439 [Crucibulum laeve]
MSADKESLILYITDERLRPELTILLDELNQPNREYREPYGLPDLIHLSPAPLRRQLGASLEDLANLHRSWVADVEISSTTNENASLFIVADEATLADAPSRSVQIVHMSPDNPTELETIRSSVNRAVGVYTAIDGGQQGWGDFMYSAQSHGGRLSPFEEDIEDGPAASVDQPPGEIKTMKLPVLQRPTE